MMWRGCELEERGGGEIIYANWILRQGTVGAVQCFWRVSEVVSEQSVEDYDCRSVSEVSGFENFLAFRIGLRISGSSRSSREILFGLSRGQSESPLLAHVAGRILRVDTALF